MRLLGIALAALICTIVVLVLLRQSLTTNQPVKDMLSVPAEPPRLVHPVFGQVHTTVAIHDKPPTVSFLGQLMMEFGLRAPPSPPSLATRTDLLIGQSPMSWSEGGYLYCHLLSSRRPLWQFASCTKTNLRDVSAQDFETSFISMGDKTNGAGAFGTNWLKNTVRVRQGQIILARLVTNPAQVYALEITEQEMARAVVNYVKKPF